jgi:hypothetical protein
MLSLAVLWENDSQRDNDSNQDGDYDSDCYADEPWSLVYWLLSSVRLMRRFG